MTEKQFVKRVAEKWAEKRMDMKIMFNWVDAYFMPEPTEKHEYEIESLPSSPDFNANSRLARTIYTYGKA